MSGARGGGAFDFVFVKPVLATLLAVTMVLLGVVAMKTMVKEGMPEVEIPTAVVTTVWPGASAELVEKEVTSELERSLRSLDRVKKVRSASMNGVSLIQVDFEATAPSEASIQKVRDEVSVVEASLPPDAEKPRVEQVRVSDRPIVGFVLHGAVDDAVLGRLALDLEKGLERLTGMRDADPSGDREEIVQVLLHPGRMDELGLSTSDIAGVIDRANVDASVGRLDDAAMKGSVDVEGRFDSLEDLGSVTVARSRKAQTPVRLEQVADIRRDLEPVSQRAAISEAGAPFEKAVIINLFRGAAVDTVRLVQAAADYLAEREARADWPHGVTVTRIDDETETIEGELGETLVNTGQSVVVVFVVLLLLLSWREALVAGLAIPVTFLGVLAVLQIAGYTLNQLVLVGLIIALGLLVDVFILVMEGMHEAVVVEGLRFAPAVRKTVKSYALPALAGQMTTILALVPLFMVGGSAGKFIQVIPTTVITALAVSFVVAFFCTLPLSRFVLKVHGRHAPSMVDRVTDALSRRLARALRGSVVRSRLVSLLFVIGAMATLPLALRTASLLDFELFPKADKPRVGLTIELEPNAELDDAEAVGEAVGEYLRAQPELRSVARYVGRKSPMSTGTLGLTESERYVGFTAQLVPLKERDLAAYELVERWRPDLEKILGRFPGAQLELHSKSGGVGSGAPVQVILKGDGVADLRRAMEVVKPIVEQTAGVSEVTDDLGPAERGFALVPRREVYDLYGLTPQGVAGQLRYSLDHNVVATFDRDGTDEPLDVRLGMRWASQGGMLGSPGNAAEVLGVSVVDGRGRRRSLEQLHDVRIKEASAVVSHLDGDRSLTIGAQLTGRSATSVAAELGPKLEEAQRRFPAGVHLRLGGESEDTAETFADVPAAFAAAVFFVFAILALLFASFRQPLIILAIVPMGLVGTLFGFYAIDMGLSFPAVVGIIALVGIVVNDSIVMVEAMNEHLAQGLSVAAAAARGASVRLRPIISTSLTTIGGLVPLAVADPTWKPLASAVVFGLLGSTVMAFVITPALFNLLTTSRRAVGDAVG